MSFFRGIGKLNLNRKRSQLRFLGNSSTGGTDSSGGGAPAYTGPLDEVPSGIVWAASSARALSSEMLGENGYTLRRASDDAEMAFSYDAETGQIDESAITAWASGDAFYKSLEDHAGSITASQNTAASQPEWSASGPNSKPSIIFDGSNDVLSTASAVTFPDGAYTFIFVCSLDIAQDSILIGIALDENSNYIALAPARTVIYFEAFDAVDTGNGAGGESTGELDITDYAIIVVRWQFGQRSVRVNGVSIDSDGVYDSGGAVPSISERLNVGADRVTPSAYFGGEAPEILLYSGYMSDVNVGVLEQNIATYYNITLP